MKVSVTQLDNGSWQTRWRDRNRRQRAKNHRTKERALAHRQALLREDEGAGHKDVELWDTFAQDWLVRYAKVENTEGSAVTAESIVRVHLTPAFTGRRLTELRKVDLLDLRARLKRGGGHSVKTINCIVGQARAMLETAVDWDLIQASPWARVKPLPLPEQRYQYWTPAERDRFLAFARRECQAFADVVAFAAHTGLRSGELVALQAKDIDFDRRTVTVADTYCSKAKRNRGHTKGKRIRHVELNEAAYRVVADRRLLEPKAAVFAFKPAGASKRLKRLAKAAGVTPIRFHDLRHTFASHLASAGVPLQHIQQLLGHSDFKLVQRYAHLMPSSVLGLTAVLMGSAQNVHWLDSKKASGGN